MIKKKWAVWVVVLIAVGVVTASTLTTLEPGTLSDKNISFASAGSNSTNYIQLPSNASVSLATSIICHAMVNAFILRTFFLVIGG